jgi:DNA-binding phage protein
VKDGLLEELEKDLMKMCWELKAEMLNSEEIEDYLDNLFEDMSNNLIKIINKRTKNDGNL